MFPISFDNFSLKKPFIPLSDIAVNPSLDNLKTAPLDLSEK